MKFYLSSKGVPSMTALKRLLGDKKLSVAVIPNAWDVYPEDRRQNEISNTTSLFSNSGFSVKLIDLKNQTSDLLEDELLAYSLIWVMGGNSFYLNEQVHKSALNKVIQTLLERGVVYGGESAGAVLACPTLHGVELLDDPEKASQTIWDGLNLVDFGIVPHWGMEKYAELLEKCRKEMEKFVTTKVITNEQAIIVDDKKVAIIEGE